MRYLATALLIICATLCLAAQEAVTWSYRLVDNNTDHPAIVMTATIHPGYHLYDINNPTGGSNPLVFSFETTGCKISGKPVANVAYTKEYDEDFEVDQYFYTGTVSFKQLLTPTAQNFTVIVDIKGQACNDKGCTQVYDNNTLTGEAPITHENDKADNNTVTAEVEVAEKDSLSQPEIANAPAQKDSLPGIANQTNTAVNAKQDSKNNSLWYVLGVALLGGIIFMVMRNKTVKFVVAFLELAVMVKLLSVVDLALGLRILDREVFLVLWIIIFTLLGLFLLGKLKLPNTNFSETVTVTRFMLAIAALVFALYMLPGLWGAPLKSISKLTPPVSTQDFVVESESIVDTLP